VKEKEEMKDGNQAKQEYVKKEFVARPYISTTGAEAEVKGLIVKNSRYILNNLTNITKNLLKF